MLKDENSTDIIENINNARSLVKGGRATKEHMVAELRILNAHIVRKWVILKKNIIPCIIF